MATKAIAGRKAKISIAATSSAASPSALAEVRDWSLPISADHIDATSNDSSGWKEFIDGEKGGTCRVGMMNLSTNSNQQTLVGVFSSGARYWFTVQPTTAKTQKWAFGGRVQSYEPSAGRNDLVLRNTTIVVTGKIFYTA